jgi:hypothetical protein
LGEICQSAIQQRFQKLSKRAAHGGNGQVNKFASGTFEIGQRRPVLDWYACKNEGVSHLMEDWHSKIKNKCPACFGFPRYVIVQRLYVAQSLFSTIIYLPPDPGLFSGLSFPNVAELQASCLYYHKLEIVVEVSRETFVTGKSSLKKR